MLTVTFDGVEYTKASEVAKQFNYTSDYIGQLCRAKKINARLVGRSWFVNVPSLEKHRAQKYQKPTIDEKTSDRHLATKEVAGAKESKVEIKKAGTTSKKYLRRVSAPNARLLKITDKGSAYDARHTSPRYEADDHSLIPKVASSPKVTLLKVDMAEAESVSVKSGQKKASKLLPEKLPDVALSGALKITEIPDAEYTNEETPVAETDEESPKEKSSKRDKSKNKVKIRKVKEPIDAENVTVESAEDTHVEAEMKAQPTKGKVKVNFAPKSTQTAKKPNNLSTEKEQLQPAEIPVANLNTSPQIIPIQVRAPITGLALGMVVATLILSAEQVALVTTEVANFSLQFDWSNVSNMALVLFTG